MQNIVSVKRQHFEWLIHFKIEANVRNTLENKINHKYHFVDPESGVHTQTVERLWGSLKWRNKRERGTTRHLMESYFAEFAWRQAHKNDDLFTCIINAIATYWPPVIKDLFSLSLSLPLHYLSLSPPPNPSSYLLVTYLLHTSYQYFFDSHSTPSY